jgi:hypothetical protein
MKNGDDPTTRRRQDREAMDDRHAPAWQLHQCGLSVRVNGRELSMPASSVQRCLSRAPK